MHTGSFVWRTIYWRIAKHEQHLQHLSILRRRFDDYCFWGNRCCGCSGSHNIVSLIEIIINEEIMSYCASLSTRMGGFCGNGDGIARIDDKIIVIAIESFTFSKEIIKIRSRQHEQTSQCDGPVWLMSERGVAKSWFPFIDGISLSAKSRWSTWGGEIVRFTYT
jgi:hypothetical protein